MIIPYDRERRLVIALAAVFVCRLVLSLALIPPWQQPDEPAQLALTEMAKHRLFPTDTPDPARQGDILASMRQHDWWRHYGDTVPDPFPTRFTEILGVRSQTALNLDPVTPRLPWAYYAPAGAMLAVAPPMSPVADLYVLRALSAVLGLLTLVVCWHAARDALGAASGAVVTAVLAVHPQFAVVSTTASPDAFVNLAGACVWWQGVRAFTGKRVARSLLAVWVAAAIAAMADRMAVPLLPIALVVTLVALVRTPMRLAVLLAPVAVALGVALLWLVNVSFDTFGSAYWERLIPIPRAQTWAFFSEFTSFLYESWWFSLGWIRYLPPSWWLGICWTVGVVAAIGLARRVVREADRDRRLLAGLAVCIVTVQLAAVYWIYLRLGNGPQGRHLFPVLLPALVLLWLGVEQSVPARLRPYAGLGLVVVMAVLDATAWILVGVPAYGT